MGAAARPVLGPGRISQVGSGLIPDSSPRSSLGRFPPRHHYHYRGGQTYQGRGRPDTVMIAVTAVVPYERAPHGQTQAVTSRNMQMAAAGRKARSAVGRRSAGRRRGLILGHAA